MTDPNRRFHELAGLCWHEIIEQEVESESGVVSFLCACGACYSRMDDFEDHAAESNPDYAADPRLVLEVMKKREDWWLFSRLSGFWVIPFEAGEKIYLDTAYILDKTGKLRDKAIEWMEGRNG
jgi:hypothetical protein